MPGYLKKVDDELHLSLSGLRRSDFVDCKEKVKDLPGRTWDPEAKVWKVPAEPQSADRILRTIRPRADQEVIDWVRAALVKHEESLTAPLPDDAEGLRIPWAYKRMPWQPEEVNDEKFDGALPYQRAAIAKIAREGRSILADDMGLGKSFEAISAIEERRLAEQERTGILPDGPRLIVCPSSVKGSWERELRRWLPAPDVEIIRGTYSARRPRSGELKALKITANDLDNDGKLTPAQVRSLTLLRAIERNAWIIVNWEQLRVEKRQVTTRNGGRRTVKSMKEPLLEKTQWLAVVADEAHRAKSITAKQTQGLWRIKGEVMLALTGTPIMNSPGEIWSLLRWLWPHEYHELGMRVNAVSYWSFYNSFVDYYELDKRRVVTGVKNPDGLRFVLKDKLIRRTAEILNLKGRKRIRYPVPLNPGQQKLYDEAETSMWLAVEKDISEGNANAIAFAREAAKAGDAVSLLRIQNGAARTVRLRQIIENAALLGGADDSANMDAFEEKFLDSGQAQWVVFCEFKDSCSLLAARLRKRFGVSVGVYTGDVKPALRTEMEDQFQAGQVNVIVGTIDALYQGINLPAAHRQFWLSRDFVEEINKQGESRQDRLGQQEKVLVYIPEAVETVAVSKVAVANELKARIVGTVLPQQAIEEVAA